MKYLLAFSASALFASAYDYVVVGSVEEDTYLVISKKDYDENLSSENNDIFNKAPKFRVFKKTPDVFEESYKVACQDNDGVYDDVGKSNVVCPDRISCNKIQCDKKWCDSPFIDDEWCYLTPDTLIDINSYVGIQSEQDKINITEQILFEMTFGIYRLSEVGKYDPSVPSPGGGFDFVDTFSRPGFAHCDINPNNLFINYSNDELQLTGYLGKQKLNDDNTYALRMDACNGSGDVKYFSPRRTALHMAKTIEKKPMAEKPERFQDIAGFIAAIEKGYKSYRFQRIPLSTEDDLWSGLLSLYEMCYPLKTLESYVEEKGIDHECTDDFVETLGVDKSVCLKGLFYNKLKNGNQNPTYVYKGVDFKDYFNFDEKCTFPKVFDTPGYKDVIDEEVEYTNLKENLERYVRFLTDQTSPGLRGLVKEFQHIISFRLIRDNRLATSNQPWGYDETG
eukprot:GHVR01067297.1.p1 GENE.GHVR01067297.1~~GHVR01067297.1.p1  ORF type:complete len:462 (-),score=100.74 GHVR01067297.1:272-1621(-)